MKHIKYFLEFLIICFLFLIFRIVGYKIASDIGYFIGKTIGPKFRTKKIIIENIMNLNSSIKNDQINMIIKKMWGNYGRILAEYVFIPSFRKKKIRKLFKN